MRYLCTTKTGVPLFFNHIEEIDIHRSDILRIFEKKGAGYKLHIVPRDEALSSFERLKSACINSDSIPCTWAYFSDYVVYPEFRVGIEDSKFSEVFKEEDFTPSSWDKENTKLYMLFTDITKTSKYKVRSKLANLIDSKLVTAHYATCVDTHDENGEDIEYPVMFGKLLGFHNRYVGEVPRGHILEDTSYTFDDSNFNEDMLRGIFFDKDNRSKI